MGSHDGNRVDRRPSENRKLAQRQAGGGDGSNDVPLPARRPDSTAPIACALVLRGAGRSRCAPRRDRAGATAGSPGAGTSLVQRRQAARSRGPTKTPASTAHSLGDLAPAGIPRGCSTVSLRRTPSGPEAGPGSVGDRTCPHQSRLADEVPASRASACRAAESAVGAPSVGDGRAGSIVGQGRERFGLVTSAWSDRQRAGSVLVT